VDSAGINALAALRARYSPADLAQAGALPYPEVLCRARERRARALEHHGLVETEESARETPVIRALDAFVREQHPEPHAAPWGGELS
jgi:hypothetical protein